MLGGRTVWLAFNEGSGSNDEAALAALEKAFDKAEVKLGRKIGFPRETVPFKELLGGQSADVLVIFAGDGTISSIVTQLYGWSGSVLVLPGGTMNLLSKRLHGDVEAAEIIARVAQGTARKVRPTIIRSRHGDGLTGMLAGPGTSWNHVREAMREKDALGIVSKAGEAIGESTGGAMVASRDPAIGRNEGYSAIMLTPLDEGIELKGFYADGIGDYFKQGVALARGDFRDGPNEVLGIFPRITLASVGDTDPVGMLIDGELMDETQPVEMFELAQCGVDLLATSTDLPD